MKRRALAWATTPSATAITRRTTRRGFPPQPAAADPSAPHRFHLDTGAGVVEVRTWHRQDPGDRHRGCPLRERWGLAAYQKLNPGWQRQLTFTLTVTTSYEGAAALLRRLGHLADDATLHTLAQKPGTRVEQQTQRQLEQPVGERTPQRVASSVGVLMLDAWQVRQPGAGWGKKKTQQSCVEWHELKIGVFYLQEQGRAKTDAAS